MASQNDANFDRLSMVPLMNSKDAHRRQQQHHDQFVNDPDWSDQEIDEFTQDPLENVLMQMRLWPQAISRQQCVRSTVFMGVIGACLGFALGYVLFMVLHPSSGCTAVSQRDRSVEARFVDSVDAASIEQFLKNFTTKSVVSGSEADDDMVKYISELWKKQGLDEVSIVPYELDLVIPDAHNSNLVEVIENDEVKFSVNVQSAPESTFNGSGSIPVVNRLTRKGPLVYVNYGRDEDYQKLNDNNVDVENSIALMRLGKINLYQKLKTAQNNKISAVLLYPDPKEYAPNGRDNVYPKSTWLPGSAIRLEQINLFPDAHPEGIKTGNLTICFQNINYDFAEKLLQLIKGQNSAQDDWKGKLNSDYKIGKSDEMIIKITLNSVSRRVTVKNIISVVKGISEQDRYVLIGNHRDSLNRGGIDPHSGTAVLLELTRTFGKLLKGGWRPKRTILFCSWSAGAYGPVGSSLWAEEFSKLLSDRVVAYLNLDVAVQGNQTLYAFGVPVLHQLLYDVTKSVTVPNEAKTSNKRTTVYDNWLKAGIREDNLPKIFDPLMVRDYSSFIHLLGIPILELRYVHVSNESHDTFPLRHTSHDDFHLVESLVDSNFRFHKSVGEIYGLLLIRLADSVLLPLNVANYSETLEARLKLLQSITTEIMELTKDISLESKLLNQAVKLFKEKCKSFQTRLSTTDFKSWPAVRQVNDQLMQVERSFIKARGVSCLPEFKHAIFSYDVTNLEKRYSFPCLDDMLTSLSSAKNNSVVRHKDIAREMSSLASVFQSATFVLEDSFDFHRISTS